MDHQAKNIAYIGLILGLVLIGHPAMAGAWPNARGQGQVIQTSLIDRADKAYNAKGKLENNVQFSKVETAVYWEHGLSDALTLVLDSRFQNINFKAGHREVQFQGFGDTNISLRHVLRQRPTSVVSIQGSVLFAGPGEIISDADLGVGSTQFEARILAGKSFKLRGKDGFIDVQAAWRARAGEFRNEWRLDATTGWRPQKNIQILAQGFYTNSQENLQKSRRNERLKLQASLVFDRNLKKSYQIGFYQTVAGKTIIKENAIFLAMWQRY